MSLANWPQLNRRVVVTGLGVISPVGKTTEETWKHLLAGKSGVGRISQFDTTDYPVKIAGEVKDFDPTSYISPKETKKMDRFVQLGICASVQAWEDAGFKGRSEDNGLDPKRIGAIISAGMGGLPWIETTLHTIREKGPRRISPFFIPAVIPNITSGHLSIMLNMQGYNVSVTSACSSSAHGIGEAALYISRGDADMMMAGGCESVVCATGIGGFTAMKALSSRNDEPERASRPFDKDRDGFVMGEGAATLILEEYEHAKKRGARIYAEVVGYGSNSDANHITAPTPDGSGAAECMRRALANGKVEKSRVGYVNAHGTSTPVGDVAESKALERLFEDHVKTINVSSTKSMTGHLLGAAGALEAAVSIKALETGQIPPTINLDNQDEECRLNYTPNEAIQRKLDVVLSNSFGFGGTNASVAFAKV